MYQYKNYSSKILIDMLCKFVEIPLDVRTIKIKTKK